MHPDDYDQSRHTSRAGIAFSPAYLGMQHALPSPKPRALLYCVVGLVACALIGIALGRVDTVAVAPGKLVPRTSLRVVQPPEAGIVRDILVREGQSVSAGQVLFRMDTRLSEVDGRILQAELAARKLQLRRIEAELAEQEFRPEPHDRPELFAQVQAQFEARRRAYRDALAAERSVLSKAEEELRSALEVEAKLQRTLPIYREQERAWEQLAREGFAGKLMALERSRNRIETEQDLHAQAAAVAGLKASIALSHRRLAQLGSNYRRELSNERVEIQAQYDRLLEDQARQTHREDRLELRAPSAGTIKDLATHSSGTVVAPGTILATLVPGDEPLEAEIWVSNLDAGTVVPGAPVRIKLAAFPFQRYGALEGRLRHLSADATERTEGPGGPGLYFRALVALAQTRLDVEGQPARISPGMQVNAEIHLGTRTVLEYLLSPLRKLASEAGREH